MIKLSAITFFAMLVAICAVPVVAQRPPKAPKPAPQIEVNENMEVPAERSIETSPKVSLDFCVREGIVRINGWDRNEVRAFVSGGGGVAFNSRQDDPQTKRTVWLNVVAADPKKMARTAVVDNCLTGDEILLDVPRGASVKIKSNEGDVRIESVARVTVESLSGEIYLRGISAGVEATTFRGDLTVENSNGRFVLSNTEGNIIAVGLAPVEIDDGFRAKTSSGRIVMKNVTHRLVETNSTTGGTSYDGDLLSGGQYRMAASNGSLVLNLNPSVLCKVNALFGFGSFASDIALRGETRREKSVNAQFGDGETTCSVSLTTASGVVRVRKRQ